MKKSSIILVASFGFMLTACEDVPAPYEVIFNDEDEPEYNGEALPFTSSALSSGFEIYTPSEFPSAASWSTGSSYVQVTGYVDADGDGKKEYNQTQSWLVTPALYTKTDESVVLNFDYTIRYGSSLSASELKANHKVYVSKNYSGDVNAATWTELDFTPSLSPYSDWTLYSSGDIEIPKEFQNVDNVYVAFFYQTTSTSSSKVSTWELENLMIYAGTPQEGGDDPTPSVEVQSMPYTSTNLGDFDVITTKGVAWSMGSTYAKASGYLSDTKTYDPTDTWLVSPAINTKTTSGVVINAQQVIRYIYNDSDLDNLTMWASTDYAGNVQTATWTQLSYKPVASSTNDWTFYAAKTVSLPSSLLNQEKVYIAYRFQCGSDASATWELKEFSIKEGTDSGSDDDPSGGGSTDPAKQISVSEFLRLQDTNTTYRLAGKIANVVAGKEQYGNFDLVDATGSIYVYGLVDANGTYCFQTLGLAEGDSIVVEGKYAEYNGKSEINKAVYISSSKGEGGGSDDPSGGDDSDIPTFTSIVNGDFETWTNDLPDHWKSASSASSATLKPSTDAHGGKYSVYMEGTSANKRLAYEETVFEAGTYTVKFFAKAGGTATSSYGYQCRVGYVPVTNGSVGEYAYQDGYSTITSDSWTEVTYTFTLESATTICLVVMNPKNCGDLYVDDYTVVKN